MKSLDKNQTYSNLLLKAEFKAALLFEAKYASVVKGGYLPSHLSRQQESRLVSDINLLNSEERNQIIHKFTLFSN